MLQRVTDAIRTLDTERWIFLEGAYAIASNGLPTRLGAVDDPTGRQIYAPHIYNLAMELGDDWDPTSSYVEDYYASVVDYGRTHEVPINVFEWGPQKPALPNVEDYVHQVMRGADTHTSGWAAFAWVKGLAGWSQLDEDGHPGAGMTDTVQVYPTHIAGRPLSIVGDYAAGTSTVEVDPVDADAEGPTNFYFPLRRFPEGPTVTVEGRADDGTPFPADSWSWTFDEANQTVSVTVDPTLAHRIIISPAQDELPSASTTSTARSGGGQRPGGDGDDGIAAGPLVAAAVALAALVAGAALLARRRSPG